MLPFMKAIFWVSMFLVLYPYLIYPLVTRGIAGFSRKSIDRSVIQPYVTVLIAAYNEEECIADTIKNKLSQSYPMGKREIIVVSDGSSDRTDDIVRGFEKDGVRLVRQEPRSGKAAALNLGVRHASGEVLVFSDANSLFAENAIEEMVKNFADMSVGYVTGLLTYASQKESVSGDGCGAYMRYENWLRTIESRLGSVIGVNGGVDAMRRDLYADVPVELISDFVLPLHVISRGYRVVFDRAVRSLEVANTTIKAEFRMRVRVALRGMQGLVYMKHLLNPFRYPEAAYSIISHKILRYLAPVFMLLAMFSNVYLAVQDPMYVCILVPHVSAYVLGMVGAAVRLPGLLHKIAYVPSYFFVSNAAFLLAIGKFFLGQKMSTWKPRTG
jgi:cellulose synthase/poly-beta-1,6-N-acetylglucosamine synthase-like glycosyltransferase